MKLTVISKWLAQEIGVPRVYRYQSNLDTFNIFQCKRASSYPGEDRLVQIGQLVTAWWIGYTLTVTQDF